ncbi:Autophagy-related protein 2-like protein A [Frankliniella fusca]|uniref:Autophagy-related protein 2-like protein A n=1 Tax=Frankliniella fusca TaxID=407009 RepID=A0AAE1H5Y8_9NEOP|nr:Autophagy-related protein 2-like protein A [Frankliniella fusca]
MAVKILACVLLLVLVSAVFSETLETVPEGNARLVKRSPVKPRPPKKNEGPKYRIPQGPMSLPTFKKTTRGSTKGGQNNIQGGK